MESYAPQLNRRFFVTGSEYVRLKSSLVDGAGTCDARLRRAFVNRVIRAGANRVSSVETWKLPCGQWKKGYLTMAETGCKKRHFGFDFTCRTGLTAPINRSGRAGGGRAVREPPLWGSSFRGFGPVRQAHGGRFRAIVVCLTGERESRGSQDSTLHNPNGGTRKSYLNGRTSRAMFSSDIAAAAT